MPQLIKHIDKIAREKGRTVLYVTFDMTGKTTYNPDKWPERQALMQWLDEHDIAYHSCGNVAHEAVMESYEGQLYIDVPFDESDPKYIELRDHLEFEDGTLKIPGINFMYLPLEAAMKNAHHDEPGFWDKWADNF